MDRWLPAVAVFAMSLYGCREPTPPPNPPLPALVEPAEHVPPPPEAPPYVRQRLVPALPPPGPPAPAPAPVAPLPEPHPAPAPPQQPAAGEPEPVDDARTEAEKWLMAANLLTPGCLLSGERPSLGLPSPAALALLLNKQPREFAGVAREALVCLLGLRRLTGAEVYGTSAFRPLARAAVINMGGGDRPQGVLVAGIATDEPRGEGTLYLALDQRDQDWGIRSALYRPWLGDSGSRRFVSLRSMRLLSPSRRSIAFRQRDRHQTTEHHIALTSMERLIDVLEVTVKATPQGRPPIVGDISVRGRGWPRQIVYRTRETRGLEDVPPRWTLTRWSAEANRPYVRTENLGGDVSEAGLRSLIEEGQPAEVDWLASKLPKRVQRTTVILRLRAEAYAARRKWKQADRYWRKAAKAKGAPAEVSRDYGRYLAGRKQRRSAVKALKRYLERVPEADDRAEIEAEIEALQVRGRGRKR